MLTQVEVPGLVQQGNHDCVIDLINVVQTLMVSNEYVLLLYIRDFIPPHAYYYYKPTTPTTKTTLPTTPIVPKKINPNSPSAIMKQKKN